MADEKCLVCNSPVPCCNRQIHEIRNGQVSLAYCLREIKKELDPALSALTFMAIHHGVLHQWVLNRYKLEGRDYVKTFRKILMDGLKAQ